MALVIVTSTCERKKYNRVNQILENLETGTYNHGQNFKCYADHFSLVLHGYIYMICFSTFFAYITLSMLLTDFSMWIYFSMAGSVVI